MSCFGSSRWPMQPRFAGRKSARMSALAYPPTRLRTQAKRPLRPRSGSTLSLFPSATRLLTSKRPRSPGRPPHTWLAACLRLPRLRRRTTERPRLPHHGRLECGYPFPGYRPPTSRIERASPFVTRPALRPCRSSGWAASDVPRQVHLAGARSLGSYAAQSSPVQLISILATLTMRPYCVVSAITNSLNSVSLALSAIVTPIAALAFATSGSE